MVWTVLVQLAWAAFFAAVSYALTPAPADAKPAELQDFRQPTIEEGRAVPVLQGRKRLRSPVVTYVGDLHRIEIKGKSK